jgi:hypothetical protein
MSHILNWYLCVSHKNISEYKQYDNVKFVHWLIIQNKVDMNCEVECKILTVVDHESKMFLSSRVFSMHKIE